MSRFKAFVQTSVIGGVAVILPVALSGFLLVWLFKMVTRIISPLTTMVIARSNIQAILANAIVISIILFGCFFIGVAVRSRLGIFIHESLDAYILKFVPGYSIIKETVMQFLGRKRFPFSEVVLVKAFENDTLMTGFVTDEHPGDLCTVFVPTGPNVTTGFVFHLSKNFVYPVDVSADHAIRTVISCGVGSGNILRAHAEKVSLLSNV